MRQIASGPFGFQWGIDPLTVKTTVPDRMAQRQAVCRCGFVVMRGNPARLVRLAKNQQRAGALEHPPYQNPHGTAENAVSPLGLTGLN